MTLLLDRCTLSIGILFIVLSHITGARAFSLHLRLISRKEGKSKNYRNSINRNARDSVIADFFC